MVHYRDRGTLTIFMENTHKRLIDKYYGKSDEPLSRSEIDILRNNFRFLLDEDDESGEVLDNSWEMRIVRAYHEKLFKEYALTDLRFTPLGTDKLALRWRSEEEVVSSKGQFICGNVPCSQVLDLSSWQVDFRYTEKGVTKAALVKLRLCPHCSSLLPRSSKTKPTTNKSAELLP